jgi:hypothetical protein
MDTCDARDLGSRLCEVSEGEEEVDEVVEGATLQSECE